MAPSLALFRRRFPLEFPSDKAWRPALSDCFQRKPADLYLAGLHPRSGCRGREAYWITMAIGLMVVLSALGIDITPIFALVGGASFIIAFAMQDTLGNLAAGLMIMFNRPFDEGDYITAGGTSGTVETVSVVSTTVKTPDNQIIVIPNSKVWGDVITNTTASPLRRVDLVFGIDYADDPDRASEVTPHRWSGSVAV